MRTEGPSSPAALANHNPLMPLAALPPQHAAALTDTHLSGTQRWQRHTSPGPSPISAGVCHTATTVQHQQGIREGLRVSSYMAVFTQGEMWTVSRCLYSYWMISESGGWSVPRDQFGCLSAHIGAILLGENSVLKACSQLLRATVMYLPRYGYKLLESMWVPTKSWVHAFQELAPLNYVGAT